MFNVKLRISVVEIVVFLFLLVMTFVTLPGFFEWPLAIGTAIILAFVSYYGWYFVRKSFSRVIFVRGLGVAIIPKDFQVFPVRLNEPVAKIVQKLRNTHTTVIVWSYTRDFNEIAMKTFGLRKVYDNEFYPSDYGTDEPQKYLSAVCSSLSVSPSKVVLIDIEEKPMEVAKSMGMTVIQYTSPEKLEESLKSIGL